MALAPPIGPVEPLAHDALGTERAGPREEVGAADLEVLAVANGAPRAGEHALQDDLAALERQRREIFTVERQQVEDEVDETAALLRAILQRVKVAATAGVEHHHLAVEERLGHAER